MGRIVLAGVFALAASTALAQTASDQPGGGSPANLCQELLAFMKAPPPEAATPAAAAPAKPAAAAESKPAAPAAGAAQADAPKPAGEGASSQEVTGQSGPATNSPDQNGSPAAAKGTAQNAPQKASVSAPVPTDGKSVSKDSVLSVAEAEGLAAADDIAACQTAARELRLAGVAMPPPLLALAALDLKYQGD